MKVGNITDIDVKLAKIDLSTYRDLKKKKSDFNNEIRKVKTCIKNKQINEAKAGLDKCDKYIDDMVDIINKLPDKSSADDIRRALPIIIGVLGAIVADVTTNIIGRSFTKTNRKYREKLDEINDKEISNYENKKKVMNKLENMENQSAYDEKEHKKLKDELYNIDKEYYKILDEYNSTSDKSKKLNKMRKINGNAEIALPMSSIAAGAVGSFISLKSLKNKSKNILIKCKKKLSDTKAYLEKTTILSESAKESFDDTLVDLYEAVTEGTIDEFEYDSLIDHLLS